MSHLAEELIVNVGIWLSPEIRHCLTRDFVISEEEKCGRFVFYHCQSIDNVNRLDMADVLTSMITQDLLNIWITKILNFDYPYFNKSEQEMICEGSIADFLRISASFQRNIAGMLGEYLEHNSQINIEGFVRFRLKDFWKSLQDQVEIAVDNYLIEREYKEFIKLLRYFVELQDPKIELVNVIIEPMGLFRLLDNDGQGIRTEYIEGLLLEMEKSELEFEDLLISALITVAPQRIVLHLSEEHPISLTLLSIFENRVHTCPGCKLCYSSQEKWLGISRKGQ